jgi:hypothetical protein
MDAGFRDNFGEQVAIRFVNVFRDWLKENTSGVILIQIRDRKTGGWQNPYESNDITELVTKPLLLLQYNWYKLQEYNQDDLLSLSQNDLKLPFYKTIFQYVPKNELEAATLNFHLTPEEKIEIAEALHSRENQKQFKIIGEFMSR